LFAEQCRQEKSHPKLRVERGQGFENSQFSLRGRIWGYSVCDVAQLMCAPTFSHWRGEFLGAVKGISINSFIVWNKKRQDLLKELLNV
jgi:hypothetical protein